MFFSSWGTVGRIRVKKQNNIFQLNFNDELGLYGGGGVKASLRKNNVSIDKIPME
jgi:hypothetical protein